MPAHSLAARPPHAGTVPARTGLVQATAGSAAAGIVMVGSLLSVLIMGMLETGNYLLSQRTVEAAVRDAAQFAASQPLRRSECGDPVTGGLVEKVRNFALTGQPVAGGRVRLTDWTDARTVTVSLDCQATVRIKVAAAVPYSALFGVLKLGRTYALRAESEASAKGL